MATLKEKNTLQNFIYTDTGGTFTDSVFITEDGDILVGKASTTRQDLEKCFFESIAAALRDTGEKLEDILKNTRVIGYGTTQGTNVIVSGIGAPNLGFITTKGQEDRTYIMRFRAAGLDQIEGMHIINADKPSPLIKRTKTRGVKERVDCFGEIVCPLDENEVRAVVKELVEKEKVEGIAVGLLWSFLNPQHEIRIREIIYEMYPKIEVALSHEVNPIVREEPRFRTTQIDLYIGRALRELLKKIDNSLKEKGYKYPLLVLQASGGVSRAEVVKPANTLHSGPVGGLAGVEFWKKVYGFENAMGSDVGGTSFDITISSKRGAEYLREPLVGRFQISNPMMEIITIGAGGGTIAYVDDVAKALRVGPKSAEADPGPVCYGKGGTEPTVTDADVVLNRIDPDNFLGGTIKLDKNKAIKSIEEKIAKPLGISVYQAADGIIKIIDAIMGSTLRRTITTRGLDPSQTVLFAFGGGGPTHCVGYSEGMGFKELIIPRTAAVFSAFGAATSDIKHRYEGSPFIIIPNLPYDLVTQKFKTTEMKMNMLPVWAVNRFNDMMESLEDKARTDMKMEGFQQNQYSLRYEMLARYGGQLWELRTEIPISRINTIDDFTKLLTAFEDEYSKTYTSGAMVPAGGIEIITIAVESIGETPKPRVMKKEFTEENPAQAKKMEREVYWNKGFVMTPVYEWDLLQNGNKLHGPLIVESQNTTFVLPPNKTGWVDEYINIHVQAK